MRAIARGATTSTSPTDTGAIHVVDEVNPDCFLPTTLASSRGPSISQCRPLRPCQVPEQPCRYR